MRRATACAAKNAARTFRPITWSKSSTGTAVNGLGRLVPALLTKMPYGSAAAIASAKAGRSVTSSVSQSAASPASRSAVAPCSISLAVRAHSVTWAPACAKAAATAAPMPRPAPVTSARRPSRRNDGVFGSAGAVIPRRLHKECYGRHSGEREYWPARHVRQILPACTAASSIRRSWWKPRRSAPADR